MLDQRTVPLNQANLQIPADGFVLSGHGAARSWLLEHATVGVGVGFDGPVGPPVQPEPEPGPVAPDLSAVRAAHAAAVDAAAALDARLADLGEALDALG